MSKSWSKKVIDDKKARRKADVTLKSCALIWKSESGLDLDFGKKCYNELWKMTPTSLKSCLDLEKFSHDLLKMLPVTFENAPYYFWKSHHDHKSWLSQKLTAIFILKTILIKKHKPHLRSPHPQFMLKMEDFGFLRLFTKNSLNPHS